jgi:hypothetical protein
MRHLSIAAALAAALTFTGCIQQIAVSTVGGMVDDGFSAFTEESDLAFAEQALPGNLKLLEVMLKNDPENTRLLRLASEGYSSYALAFLEDSDPERAKEFYLRGRAYALRILRQDADMAKALDGSADELAAVLARRGRSDVPAVFWTAFGWGAHISLSLNDPNALAGLPKAEAMMLFVSRTDSTFYFAGADVFLGMLYGSRPKMFGGDPVRSRAHFERALRLNQGKFLMTYVYFARSYAVLNQDQPLFDQCLATVDSVSLEILPAQRLANAVAKKKGQMLRAKAEELF